MTKMETRRNIFISYSHQDKDWLVRLNDFLKPLVRSIEIDVWDDTKISLGETSHDKIIAALDKAQIAILLVSSNFLASDFILDEELPKIFKKASNEGLTVVWIALDYCLYEETELANYKAANNPSKPLESLPLYKQNKTLVDICQKVKSAVQPDSGIDKTAIIADEEVEIAPDDWNNNPNSFFNKIKKLLK